FFRCDRQRTSRAVRHRRRVVGEFPASASAQSRSRAAEDCAGRSWQTLASMILDTPFLSDLHHEQQEQRSGPATAFIAAHRTESFLATVISVGELVPIFPSEAEARTYFHRYRILRLHLAIAYMSGGLHREISAVGQRLGENDKLDCRIL